MSYQNDPVSTHIDSHRVTMDDVPIVAILIAYKIILIGAEMESSRPLATDDEFCAFAGITKQQSAQLRYLGKGPRFIRVTGRQIRYAWSDIEEWCEVRTVSRSDQRGELPASQRK